MGWRAGPPQPRDRGLILDCAVGHSYSILIFPYQKKNLTGTLFSPKCSGRLYR
jgi:hypothetical protein